MRTYLGNGTERLLHLVREDVDYYAAKLGDGPDWELSWDGRDDSLIMFFGPTAEEDARDALRAIGVLLGMEEKA